MIKKFLEWIQVKESLHEKTHEAPLVRERDVWWISFGEDEYACLNQVRVVDHRRLSTRIGVLSKGDFWKAVEGFNALYVNNIPRQKGQGRG